jgi:predicted DNA binding CopG/RHH family protein
MKKKLKKIPALASDARAERFVAEADLTQYSLADFTRTRFEFEPKSHTVSVRMPQRLYAVVQRKAAQKGIKTQRFIRQALEEAVT